MEDKKIPVHQWTNGSGEVLVVRFVSKEGKSYGDFQHPMKVGETVTAPDWDSAMKCGGGIHGWPWAIGLGEGKECEWNALWQVYSVRPEDIVGGEGDLLAKAKFRTGMLRFMGHWADATNFVLSGQMAWVFHNSSGSASNSGYSGSASNSGYSGCAIALGIEGSASNSGSRGSASNSGYRGSASNSGYSGSASNSGYSGSASNSGDNGSASNSGEEGCAIALGIEGSASGIKGSWITVAEWKSNKKGEWHRVAVQTAKVDGIKIKANTAYQLKRGKFMATAAH